MKIKNDKGEEVEVFTAEELQQKVKDAETTAAEKAVADYKTANPDKATEIEKLKSDLTKAQEDLDKAEKAGDKDGQVTRLRKERDDAMTKMNQVVTDISKKFDDFTTLQVKEFQDELLNKLSNGNAETRKKIELEFDSYKPGDKSKKGIQERMAVAAQIVTGKKPQPNFMDNIGGGGDRGSGGGEGSGANDYKPTTNQIAIGKVLGISDEDRKKYAEFKKRGGK